MRIEGTDALKTGQQAIRSVNQDITSTQAKNFTEKPGYKPDNTTACDNIRKSEFDKKNLSISDKAVIDAIERANDALSISNRKFEYSIHEETKEIMIKVIDSQTDEVIREIPPEKILDMVAKMWEMAGILVDERR